MTEKEVADIMQRLATLETDIRWIKWIVLGAFGTSGMTAIKIFGGF